MAKISSILFLTFLSLFHLSAALEKGFRIDGGDDESSEDGFRFRKNGDESPRVRRHLNQQAPKDSLNSQRRNGHAVAEAEAGLGFAEAEGRSDEGFTEAEYGFAEAEVEPENRRDILGYAEAESGYSEAERRRDLLKTYVFAESEAAALAEAERREDAVVSKKSHHTKETQGDEAEILQDEILLDEEDFFQLDSAETMKEKSRYDQLRELFEGDEELKALLEDDETARVVDFWLRMFNASDEQALSTILELEHVSDEDAKVILDKFHDAPTEEEKMEIVLAVFAERDRQIIEETELRKMAGEADSLDDDMSKFFKLGFSLASLLEELEKLEKLKKLSPKFQRGLNKDEDKAEVVAKVSAKVQKLTAKDPSSKKSLDKDSSGSIVSDLMTVMEEVEQNAKERSDHHYPAEVFAEPLESGDWRTGDYVEAESRSDLPKSEGVDGVSGEHFFGRIPSKKVRNFNNRRDEDLSNLKVKIIRDHENPKKHGEKTIFSNDQIQVISNGQKKIYIDRELANKLDSEVKAAIEEEEKTLREDATVSNVVRWMAICSFSFILTSLCLMLRSRPRLMRRLAKAFAWVPFVNRFVNKKTATN